MTTKHFVRPLFILALILVSSFTERADAACATAKNWVGGSQATKTSWTSTIAFNSNPVPGSSDSVNLASATYPMTTFGGVNRSISCLTMTAGALAPGAAQSLTINGDSFAASGGSITSGSTLLTVIMAGIVAQTFQSTSDILGLTVNGTQPVTIQTSNFSLGANGITVAAGATLDIQAGRTITTSTITVNGTLKLRYGATLGSALTTVTLGAAGIIEIYNASNAVSGTINGASGVTGTVSLPWSLTTNATPVLTIATGATLEVPSGKILTALGGITASGTLKVLGGGIAKIGHTKTLTVNSGGTVRLAGLNGSKAKLTVNGDTTLLTSSETSNTFAFTVAGTVNFFEAYVAHMNSTGIELTGAANVAGMDFVQFDYPQASGYFITMATSYSPGDGAWKAVSFNNSPTAVATPKNIDTSGYSGAALSLPEAYGVVAGGGFSNPTAMVGNTKIKWGQSLVATVACTAPGPTLSLGVPTPSASSTSFTGTGYSISSSVACSRTPSRFTKFSYPNSSAVITSNDTRRDWTYGVGGADPMNEVYALQTGDVLIMPPMLNSQVVPTYTVAPQCPTGNKTINWIFTSWPDGALSLSSWYLMGQSTLLGATSGRHNMQYQYDVTGAKVWPADAGPGSYVLPGACSGGSMSHPGSGVLNATSLVTSTGAGIYTSASGQATFSLPQAPTNLSGKYKGLTFEGLQYDSVSSSTWASDADTTVGVTALSSCTGDGTCSGAVLDGGTGSSFVLNIEKICDYTKDPTKPAEVAAATNNATITGCDFIDTITLTSINLPRPGMHYGTVTRAVRTAHGTSGATLTPGGQASPPIACIAHYAADKGSRIICSGKHPTSAAGEQIPYSVTLLETQTMLTVTGPVCPTTYGTFVPVSLNSDVNVAADFCVAKYEMKISSGEAGTTAYGSIAAGSKPASQSTQTPWTQITQANAAAECASLGTGYSLISNPEWQAIAREIETKGTSTTNWSNLNVNGTDYLNTGVSDTLVTFPQDAGDGSNPCVNNGNRTQCLTLSHADFKYKRTHTLKSGDIIWDIAGNADEYTTFVSNTLAEAALITSGNVCLRTSWLTDGTHDGTAALWGPYGAVNATYAYTGANKCVAGSYYGGLGSSSIDNATAGWVYVRGGFFGNSPYVTGIYQGKNVPGATGVERGFRCVYHP